MNIAIVAPSPVPFALGGAENLALGLFEALGARHRVELIKLPSREHEFWQLIDSYRAWFQLDLSHFDRVISLKYPAWMVQHPNHAVYMLHTLRGLYDTYHYFRLPERLEQPPAEVVALQRFMADNPHPEAVPELFARLDALRNLPKELVAFPGPLIRQIVHFLDGVALGSVRAHFAISQTVADRRSYFPPGARVRVAHPPSRLTGFHCRDDAFLFTSSRLDGPKRVALLVEAMKLVRAPIELRIAGTGPEEARIRALAGADERIKFLGFVDDQTLLGHYADALAVPFVPLEEDYGLVAVEAMMSGKPVLTVTDSGGPNELVRNGETGFSVAPEPRALAERIEWLAGHREEARAMGRKARRQVEAITWDAVVGALLGDEKPRAPRPARKKLTVATTFPVWPPRGGGQSRVFHLYRQLAKYVDVDLVTIAFPGEPSLNAEIAPGMREFRVQRSEAHLQAERAIEGEVKVPLTDVVLPRLFRLTPAYLEELRDSARTSAALIACHPYTLPPLRAVADKPLWYEAQDVETELKAAIIPPSPITRELLADVERVERESCASSALIFTCSTEDGATLQRMYGADRSRIVEVPNGVDLETVRFVSPQERREARQRLKLESEVVAVFMGSWHGPNLDAIREIFRFATRCPQVRFLVVGSSCGAFKDEKLPANVGLLGVLDDEAKDAVLGLADVALNPVVSGSGTNLKMLDYFASGLPVISTPYGARGLRVRDREHLILAGLRDFPDAIAALVREPEAERDARVARARKLAEEVFAWPVIAAKFWSEISARKLL